MAGAEPGLVFANGEVPRTPGCRAPGGGRAEVGASSKREGEERGRDHMELRGHDNTAEMSSRAECVSKVSKVAPWCGCRCALPARESTAPY